VCILAPRDVIKENQSSPRVRIKARLMAGGDIRGIPGGAFASTRFRILTNLRICSSIDVEESLRRATNSCSATMRAMFEGLANRVLRNSQISIAV
jgi:hypothetical protein